MIALVAIACAAKEIPPHLRVDPADRIGLDPVGTTLEDLVAHDPLVRRPVPGPVGHWQGLGDPVEAWAALARRENLEPTDWDALEARLPGTLAIPLARGARLAVLEVRASEELTPHAEASVARWLGHIQANEQSPGVPPGAPLAWLDPKDPLGAVVHIAERQVLLGWLDGPAIPVVAAAAAMQPGVHDRLIDSPAGHLVIERAQHATDPTAHARGLEALARATSLALENAAADRDAEQRAIAQTTAAARAELGGEPVAVLLARARMDLSSDAASDVSTGLAIVALSAERLVDSCPDRPCNGLDRTLALARAEAWGPEVARWARAWRLVSLKQAVDAFEVAYDRPTFYQVIPGLADALVGNGASNVPLVLLQQRSANPVVLLAVSRAAAGVDATDEEGTELALRKRLAEIAALVASDPPDAAIGAIASRVRARAEKPPELHDREKPPPVR
jgi:hypothetical protein